MHRRDEYRAWWNMVKRCTDPANASYPNWGGRGINVCDRWLKSFDAFYEDLGPRPSADHSLDRIDNEWHYQPDNCRWATMDIQITNARQKMGCHRLTVNGITRDLTGWARQAGISAYSLRRRLSSGWPPEVAVTLPSVKKLERISA